MMNLDPKTYSYVSKKSNNYDLKATDNIEKDIKVNSDEQLLRILQSIVLKRTKKKIIFVADNEKNKEKLIFYIKNLFKNEEFILRTNKSNFTDCFDDQEIVDILELPAIKIHCSVLAEEAIHRAIDDFKSRRNND